jgi:hypothetical protein
MSDERMRETGYSENKGFGFYSFQVSATTPLIELFTYP